MQRTLRLIRAQLRHVRPYARAGMTLFLCTTTFVVITSIIFGQQGVREWIGALSGWAAALGALIVGAPTLRYMRYQMKLSTVEKRMEDIDTIDRSLSEIRQYLTNNILQKTDTDITPSWFLEMQVALQKSVKRMPSYSRSQANHAFDVFGNLHTAQEEILGDEYTANPTMISESTKVMIKTQTEIHNAAAKYSRQLLNESEEWATWKRQNLINS